MCCDLKYLVRKTRRKEQKKQFFRIKAQKSVAAVNSIPSRVFGQSNGGLSMHGAFVIRRQ